MPHHIQVKESLQRDSQGDPSRRTGSWTNVAIAELLNAWNMPLPSEEGTRKRDRRSHFPDYKPELESYCRIPHINDSATTKRSMS